MSATKVLDMAERQGLLDARVISGLRKQVAESKFLVTPEALAKVLVDNGHLTAYQARKLVAQALGESTSEPSAPAPSPAPTPPPAAKPPAKAALGDDLSFADEPPKARPAAAAPPPPEDDILDLESVPPPPPLKSAPRPPAAAKPAPPRPAPQAPTPVDDEVIDLESAVPAPAGYKPPASPAPLAPPRPAAPPALQPLPPARPATAPPPVLQPLPPARPAPALTPLPPAPGPALQPLPPASYQPAMGLAPLGATPGADLLLDPYAAGNQGGFGSSLGAPPGAPPLKSNAPTNRWDSQWLFIGCTALGLILVALALLLLSLTRGNAAQMLQKAEEEYNSGSYNNAYASFDKFLKSFPSDPQAPKARIRRGMSRLRQASDGGKNPREALKIAREVLPELLKEGEPFNDARLELASILPEIADQFANQAKAAQDTSKRQDLVKLTDEALELVNLPDYIPPNLRLGQQSRIDAINEKLLQARRTIDEDQEFVSGLAKMQELIQAGKVVEAYQVRQALLKKFPKLEQQTSLVAATASAATKEKELVQVVERTIAPTTDDPGELSQPTILSSREGKEAPGMDGRQLVALVQGAVYGLDGKSGKALWRRFIGLESTTPPQTESRQPGADVFSVDARDHSLLRLEAATGKLKWKVTLGEPFTGPTIAGEKLYVSTAQGQIVEIEAANGHIARAAQLPQGLAVPPAVDAKQGLLFQVGKHSTLFVLAIDTLACQQTIYLAHKATGVAVPPVLALGQLLLFDNAGPDFSWMHFYSTGEDGKGIRQVQESLRLKGRVTSPAGIYRNRAVVVTDLGEIVALEFEPSNADKPVQIVGREVAREGKPRVAYQASIPSGQQLWIALGNLARYEVQASLQQLSRKWVTHNGDEFLAPLQLFGETTLVHVRKQSGAAGVTVEACNTADGKPFWSTQLATPMAGISVDAASGKVTAVSSRGAMFELGDQRSLAVEANWRPPAEPLLRLACELPLGDTSAVCFPQAGGNRGLLLAGPSGSPQVVNWFGDEAALAPPTPFRNGLLVPLRSGRVQLVDPATGQPQLLPFLPALEPGQSLRWTQPVLLPGQPNVFFIAEQNRRLFRVGVKDQPQPHLTELAQSKLDVDLLSPLAATKDGLYAIAAGDEGDVLLAINPKTLSIVERWPQTARWTGGPWVLGNTIVVSLDDGRLVCVEGNQIRWTTSSTDLQPAAPLLASGENLLVVTVDGKVQLVSGATGEVVASANIGQPLGTAIAKSGQMLLIAGADGVVHRIALPGNS